MQVFQSKSKTHIPHSLLKTLLFTGFLCVVYIFASLIHAYKNSDHLYLTNALQNSLSSHYDSDTSLEHIVFGIASNKESWLQRKKYVRLWWRPEIMRGCVFLEAIPTNSTNQSTSLPTICISNETSRFRYTFRGGLPSAIRVARVVLETVALNHSNARWYVFGDDDTIFFPENLVKTLAKYDHGLWYYVGTNSEMLEQNKLFGFEMAFGGAGFAISYPLAKVVAKVFDSCLERYPHLYGSDSRVHSCMCELGVTLTHEPGFHQLDIRGNMFGLLASHPLKPLVSLHHLEKIDPIFPEMSKIEALEHLFKAMKVDSERILQQAVCYDRWYSWTISISWGYAVQIFRNHVFLPDILKVQHTFGSWNNRQMNTMYNTIAYHSDPCQRSVVLFFDGVDYTRDGKIISVYNRMTNENCSFDMGSPRKIHKVNVFSQKLDQNIKQLLAPRRQCCDLLNYTNSGHMNLSIRECGEEELIFMHS